MANGTRPIAPIRKVSAAVLGTIAVFIMLFGAGMTSWPIAALGIALLVLAISLLVTNVMRRGPRALVQGTAEVRSISEAPAGQQYGRAEMQVRIDAPGLPIADVRIRDPRVPVDKWPDPGALLPVLVAMDDMRYARIQWDDVLTHAEAAAGMGETAFLGQHDEDVEDLLREAEQTPWDRRAEDNPGGTPLYTDEGYAASPYTTDSYPPEPPAGGGGGGAPVGGDIPHGRTPQDDRPNPVVIRETPGGGIVLEGSFVAKDDPGVTQLPHRARRPRPHRTDAAAAGHPTGTALADPPPAPGARSEADWSEADWSEPDWDDDDRDPETDIPLEGAWSSPPDETADRPSVGVTEAGRARISGLDVPDGDYSPRTRAAADLDPEMGSAYSPRGSASTAAPSAGYSPRVAGETSDRGDGYSPRVAREPSEAHESYSPRPVRDVDDEPRSHPGRTPRGEGRPAARPRSTDDDAEDDTRPSPAGSRGRRTDEDLAAPSPFVDDEAYADHDDAPRPADDTSAAAESSGHDGSAARSGSDGSAGSAFRTAAAAAAGAAVGAAAARFRNRRDREPAGGDHEAEEVADERPSARDRFTSDTDADPRTGRDRLASDADPDPPSGRSAPDADLDPPTARNRLVSDADLDPPSPWARPGGLSSSSGEPGEPGTAPGSARRPDPITGPADVAVEGPAVAAPRTRAARSGPVPGSESGGPGAEQARPVDRDDVAERGDRGPGTGDDAGGRDGGPGPRGAGAGSPGRDTGPRGGDASASRGGDEAVAWAAGRDPAGVGEPGRTYRSETSGAASGRGPAAGAAGREAAGDAGWNPAGDVGRDPADDAGREPTGDAGWNSAGDVERDAAGDAGREPAGDVGRDPAADAGRDSARTAGWNPAGDVGRDPAGDVGRDSAGDVGRDLAGKAGWNSAGDTGRDPATGDDRGFAPGETSAAGAAGSEPVSESARSAPSGPVKGLIAGVKGFLNRLTGPPRDDDGPAARKLATVPRPTSTPAEDDPDLPFEARRPTPRPRPTPGERRRSPGERDTTATRTTAVPAEGHPERTQPDELDIPIDDEPATGPRPEPAAASGTATAVTAAAAAAGAAAATAAADRDSGTASDRRSDTPADQVSGASAGGLTGAASTGTDDVPDALRTTAGGRYSAADPARGTTRTGDRVEAPERLGERASGTPDRPAADRQATATNQGFAGSDTIGGPTTGRDTGTGSATSRNASTDSAAGHDTSTSSATDRDTDTGPATGHNTSTGPATGHDTSTSSATDRDTGTGPATGTNPAIGRDTGAGRARSRATETDPATGRDTGMGSARGLDTGTGPATGRDAGTGAARGRGTSMDSAIGRDTGTGPVSSEDTSAGSGRAGSPDVAVGGVGVSPRTTAPVPADDDIDIPLHDDVDLPLDDGPQTPAPSRVVPGGRVAPVPDPVLLTAPAASPVEDADRTDLDDGDSRDRAASAAASGGISRDDEPATGGTDRGSPRNDPRGATVGTTGGLPSGGSTPGEGERGEDESDGPTRDGSAVTDTAAAPVDGGARVVPGREAVVPTSPAAGGTVRFTARPRVPADQGHDDPSVVSYPARSAKPSPGGRAESSAATDVPGAPERDIAGPDRDASGRRDTERTDGRPDQHGSDAGTDRRAASTDQRGTGTAERDAHTDQPGTGAPPRDARTGQRDARTDQRESGAPTRERVPWASTPRPADAPDLAPRPYVSPGEEPSGGLRGDNHDATFRAGGGRPGESAWSTPPGTGRRTPPPTGSGRTISASPTPFDLTAPDAGDNAPSSENAPTARDASSGSGATGEGTAAGQAGVGGEGPSARFIAPATVGHDVRTSAGSGPADDRTGSTDTGHRTEPHPEPASATAPPTAHPGHPAAPADPDSSRPNTGSDASRPATGSDSSRPGTGPDTGWSADSSRPAAGPDTGWSAGGAEASRSVTGPATAHPTAGLGTTRPNTGRGPARPDENAERGGPGTGADAGGTAQPDVTPTAPPNPRLQRPTGNKIGPPRLPKRPTTIEMTLISPHSLPPLETQAPAAPDPVTQAPSSARDTAAPSTTDRRGADTDPRPTAPDTTGPETTGPETTRSDTARRPDTARSGTARPDTTRQDTTGPDTAGPDMTRADMTGREAARSDTTGPDSTETDTARTTADVPDAAWSRPGAVADGARVRDSRAAAASSEGGAGPMSERGRLGPVLGAQVVPGPWNAGDTPPAALLDSATAQPATHGGPAHSGPAHSGPAHAEPAHSGPTHAGPNRAGSADSEPEARTTGTAGAPADNAQDVPSTAPDTPGPIRGTSGGGAHDVPARGVPEAGEPAADGGTGAHAGPGHAAGAVREIGAGPDGGRGSGIGTVGWRDVDPATAPDRPLSRGAHRAPDEVRARSRFSDEPDGASVDDLITVYPSARPGASSGIHGVGITILVTELDRSIEFYRDVLGFHEIDRGEHDVFLASGDTRLVLRIVSDSLPAQVRTVHVNLEVGDVRAVYDALRRKGVSFAHEPQPINRGEKLELWAAAFADPDGNGITVSQWRTTPPG
ncbi:MULTISPECIES: VOC family protein [Catenuloplanes]|uniref:Catechol 2,3-dioxygenase-like lactoylglutathione lyase family enzyme n=1 Tax=Catenuloplanes niger TaxID=587534 RepID=A0AAE3ZLK3_9ACTN|nr:VOC family protein [Catenuloplanes niger]MDR7322057.1 catechol 2,3-dioxygenase-like lactoylglutathione lyase family enzyme [Catenuloplanes niger]